jgi:hypothetical protein
MLSIPFRIKHFLLKSLKHANHNTPEAHKYSYCLCASCILYNALNQPLMKNKTRFLLLLVLLTGLYSCDKAPQKTIIQGHITAYGTNKPIEGARIYLWCYDGEIFGPTRSSFVDSLVTDETGAFHTEYLDRELCGGIYLSAYKEGYFYRNDIDIHGGVNDLDVVLDPEAWLELKTIPDQGGSSIIVAGSNFYGASGFDVYSNQGNTNFVFKTKGNEIKYIRWYSGIGNNDLHQDSIFLSGLDTTIYTIHY